MKLPVSQYWNRQASAMRFKWIILIVIEIFTLKFVIFSVYKPAYTVNLRFNKWFIVFFSLLSTSIDTKISKKGAETVESLLNGRFASSLNKSYWSGFSYCRYRILSLLALIFFNAVVCLHNHMVSSLRLLSVTASFVVFFNQQFAIKFIFPNCWV